MYKWSNRSKSHLSKLHPLLQVLLTQALNHCDITIMSSLRGHSEQQSLHASGASKVQWPMSKHNRTLDPTLEPMEMELSDAVDIVPYPEMYSDVEQMTYLIGIVKGIASVMGINIRCGLDWNGDGRINNEKGDFYDVCHLELVWDK